jgi:hypothetical protein
LDYGYEDGQYPFACQFFDYFEPQITDVNLGQAHYLPLRTPTLDFFTRTHQ